MIVRNNSGFTLVFLLLTLPVLTALLTLIYQLVFLFELKNEFRFKCISQSLTLLKEDRLSEASVLLNQLQSIESPIRFRVELLSNPNTETEAQINDETNLVFKMNYQWIADFELTCGVAKLLKDDQWQYEIIYQTEEVRF